MILVQGRRTLRLYSACAKAFNVSSANFSSTKASSMRSNIGGRYTSGFAASRTPVELGAALSLMPLHSATASALHTSLLSLQHEKWGYLSEGLATPL